MLNIKKLGLASTIAMLSVPITLGGCDNPATDLNDKATKILTELKALNKENPVAGLAQLNEKATKILTGIEALNKANPATSAPTDQEN
ncbi:hypothetical protein C0030_005995 [Candidatus Liberibacter solanacearum]|uniref:Lipoprotein n=1 Tax=Candidatus Liberibacter solanacearum TaxID=556287 RepID=A0A3R7TIS4_9HYPH|nr:hypothetical protein [Candidatus Liberibacter solanacearum]RPD36758.1 hypothetical protein C0030_005995 [Candidatus Liberibacter solanacearum]